MKAITKSAQTVLATVVLAASVWALLPAAHSQAAEGCDRVASPSGSDANSGTAAAPWLSVTHLVEHLSSGQTGCFRAGEYAFSEADIVQSGVTLTSYPGERATLKGTLKIEVGANGDTVRDLDLDGRGATDIGPFVFGNEATFDDVDVTNHNTEVCFLIGSANPSDPPATHTVIENSRVHDCGKRPSTNQDHGIYVDHAVEPIIRDNLIYDNVDRGIQLYPDAHDAQIYGNVIDGNGEGIIVSDGSSDNVISNNVISNSTIRWNVETSNLHGTGNILRDNCVWASNGSQNGYYAQAGGVMPAGERGAGLSAPENTVVNPGLASAATPDLSSEKASACLGRSTAPAAPAPAPPATVTLRPVVTHVHAGMPVALRGEVSNGSGGHVTVQIRRHKHWLRFASAKVESGGKFKLRKRLRRSFAATSRVRLRARAPRLNPSRTVAIRVRG